MGYDIYGTEPTAQEGFCFRRSIWTWPPLAALCGELVPEFTKQWKYWIRTQGAGLTADAAAKLAERLHSLIADETIAEYMRRFHAKRARFPDISCEDCDGKGRIPRGLYKIVDTLPGPLTREGNFICLSCGGIGHRRPFAAYRLLDEGDVREWVVFLRSCGGFWIN